MTKLKVHGIRTIAVGKQNRLIELHDVLYVPNIADTIYSIIEHSHQPEFLVVIKNGATTVGFTTFILLENTNKEISLDVDLPFKEQNSQPYYTNPPNYFKNTTVCLIHEKSDIPTRSTNDSDAYDLHNVEQVSIKPGETKKINSGLNIHLHQGSFRFVSIQSSIASNHGIMVPTSTIYRDYTIKISAVLQNQSTTTFFVK